MERSTIDLWVGLFVLAGIGALLVLALKVGNMGSLEGGQKSYRVFAEFDDIGGLKVRSAVKSAGVVVGRVNAIEFDNQKLKAKVTLQMDGRYQFPKDTSAAIRTSGLLGEQYIGLDGGGDEAMLADGDTMTLTQSAVVLEKLIGQFLYSKAADSGGK